MNNEAVSYSDHLYVFSHIGNDNTDRPFHYIQTMAYLSDNREQPSLQPCLSVNQFFYLHQQTENVPDIPFYNLFCI